MFFGVSVMSNFVFIQWTRWVVFGSVDRDKEVKVQRHFSGVWGKIDHWGFILKP